MALRLKAQGLEASVHFLHSSPYLPQFALDTKMAAAKTVEVAPQPEPEARWLGASLAFSLLPKGVVTELVTSGISVGCANTITNPLGTLCGRGRGRST